MCEDQSKVNFLSTLFFIGNAVTVLWLPRFSDKSGRKYFFGAGVVFDFFLYSSIFLIRNLNIMMMVMFLFGASNVMRTQIGWVYMMEFNP